MPWSNRCAIGAVLAEKERHRAADRQVDAACERADGEGVAFRLELLRDRVDSFEERCPRAHLPLGAFAHPRYQSSVNSVYGAIQRQRRIKEIATSVCTPTPIEATTLDRAKN